MARTAEGWVIYVDPRTGNRIVRFRHAGRRHNLSTGTSDPVEAQERAARIYSDAVAGRTTSRARRSSGTVDLDVALAEWIASLTLHPKTVELYEMYATCHWQPRWRRVDQIDEAAIDTYTRDRLRHVTRSTVLKELAAMRGFLRDAHRRGHLAEVPEVASPERSQQGKRHPTGTRQTIELSEDEVLAVIAAMPEVTRYGNRPRDFFTVLYETGLRRSTLFRLQAPEDYYRGRATLRIRAEADKAKFARELPLTSEARAALDRCTPKGGGQLFPEADYRETIRHAAREAGLEEHRAARLSFHDFRHARTTHLLERSRNLAGVAFLVGHKQITTTNRYTKPSQRAGEAVLVEAFGPPSGHRLKKSPPKKPTGRPKSTR